MNELSIPLVHSALEPAESSSGDLSDRMRFAAILQGAALLSHLERVGLRLSRGWQNARLDREGVLRGVEVESGFRREAPQVELRELIGQIFEEERSIGGKGQARKIARELQARWSHDYPPISPNRLVEEILDAATWLWESGFAAARPALAAQDLRPERRWLVVAGPAGFRRRLRRAADFEPDQAVEILSSVEARQLYFHDLPQGPLAEAEYYYDRGRFLTCLECLKHVRGKRASIVRTWCQCRLGQSRNARMSLKRLESEELSSEETLEVAAAAVRVFARLGSPEGASDWLARASSRARGKAKLRVALLEAENAWDRSDGAAMKRALKRAKGASSDPDLVWRWHHAQGLAAMGENDGVGVVREIGQALLLGRRHLRSFEAAALWNDLAVGRVWSGDLAGAERACQHMIRLWDLCEGAKNYTRLTNLAEVRLRRGRPQGVQGILENSLRFNRETGNRLAEIQDLELWVRLDLVQGRLRSALARLDEMLETGGKAAERRRLVIQALRARALGWLGRSREAEEALENLRQEDLAELDPEERPAVWALAGRREEALEAAAGTKLEEFWRAALHGEELAFSRWDLLDDLEDYCAARLVFDLESVQPEFVPEHRVARAAATLRGVGAHVLAERLDVRAPSPWGILAEHLQGERGSLDQLAKLFSAAGRAEVVLEREDAAGRVERLFGGEGGEQVLEASVGAYNLRLKAAFVDDVARGLFALAVRELAGRAASSPSRTTTLPRGILGANEAFVQAVDRARRFASKDMPILVLGESGTGKELVAKAIHRASPRREGAYLPLNCAAISESLLHSDLFGHVRGAFTGAERDRAGIFEAARGGTVFLDEIGDLPLNAQGSLLRVLQEGEIRRVGESISRKVDVRVVAATHRDLEAMVRDGTFRKDLFFRLKVVRVLLPPLRDRGDDILLLADAMLEKLDAKVDLSRAARDALSSFRWPGNVRELGNVLEVAALLCEEGRIEVEHLDLDLDEEQEPSRSTYHRAIDAKRKQMIEKALAESKGNRAEAARHLGLSRQSLSYLIRRLGIKCD